MRKTDTSAFADSFEELAKHFNARTKTSPAGFLGHAAKRMCLNIAGVDVTLDCGPLGGLAVLEGFRGICVFQLSIGGSEPRLGLTEEVTQEVGAPFTVFSNPGALYTGCIRRAFTDWERWRWLLPLRISDRVHITLCSNQCELQFDSELLPKLKALLPQIARMFGDPPFALVQTSQLRSRYSEQTDVKVNETDLPPELRPLLSLATEWSIGDEAEVFAYARKVGKRRTAEFVSTFRKHREAIDRLSDHTAKAPIPDAIVVFELASHAYALLAQR